MIFKPLDLILNYKGKYWIILGWEVIWSLLHFRKLNYAIAVWRGAKQMDRKPNWEGFVIPVAGTKEAPVKAESGTSYEGT